MYPSVSSLVFVVRYKHVLLFFIIILRLDYLDQLRGLVTIITF